MTCSSECIDIFESSTITSVDTQAYSHTWKIVNFIAYKSRSDIKLQSSRFCAGKDNAHCCAVLLSQDTGSPRVGSTALACQYEQIFALYLYFKSSSPDKVAVSITLSTVTESGTKRHLKTVPNFTYVSNAKLKLCSFSKRNVFETSRTLRNGDLILIFDLTEFQESASIAKLSTIPSCLSKVKQFMSELGELYKTGNFTDFVIQCQGKDFHVHKVILAARSSVFSAMFDSNMAETRENKVILEDVDPESMDAVLKWAYTGDVEGIVGKAACLLPVADKYDFKLLKSFCENTLISELSDINACNFLSLAHVHNANKLEKFAIQYIKRNFKAVKQTAGFLNNVLISPELMALIFGIDNYQEHARGVKRKLENEESDLNSTAE